MAEEKRIDLTDDQYYRLLDDRSSLDALGEVLGKAMVAASDEFLKRDRKFWESVRELAGVDDRVKVQINWLTRQVVIEAGERE